MDTSAFRGGIPALMTPCNEDRSPDFDALVEKAKELTNINKKVKNINEYEEYLRDYSENSDYPNINN